MCLAGLTPRLVARSQDRERAGSGVAGREAVRGSSSSNMVRQGKLPCCSVVAGAFAVSSFPSFRRGGFRVSERNGSNGRAGSRGSGTGLDGQRVHCRYTAAAFVLFADVLGLASAVTLAALVLAALLDAAWVEELGGQQNGGGWVR